MKYTRTQKEICSEIYRALEKHGANADILSIVGSWMDTMDDEEILSMLIDYNRGEPLFSEVIASTDRREKTSETCHPAIYNHQYHIWRGEEYLGIATYVDDRNIGDSFVIPEGDNYHVCNPDHWELIEKQL